MLTSCATSNVATSTSPSSKRELIIYFPSPDRRITFPEDGPFADPKYMFETTQLEISGIGKTGIKRGKPIRIAISNGSYTVATKTTLASAGNSNDSIKTPGGKSDVYLRMTLNQIGGWSATGLPAVSGPALTRDMGFKFRIVDQKTYSRETGLTE